MNSNMTDKIELSDDEQDFDILQELEQQVDEHIRHLRMHERLTIKAKVILQPGNSSSLLDYKVQGIMGDISEGGCRAMFPIPIIPGDIYRLEVEQNEFELPLIFARCVRCKLVREDAFEAGFSFFVPLKFPANLGSNAKNDLL
jgi:hypothetical protein